MTRSMNPERLDRHVFTEKPLSLIDGCRFKPTKVELASFAGHEYALIAWDGDRPHVDFYDGISSRIMLEGVVSFCRRVYNHPVIIESLTRNKNLFDTAAKHCDMRYLGRRFDEYGRGVIHSYEVRPWKNTTA